MSNPSVPSSPSPQPAIGIDLGTTYSVVAHVDATGRPMTVPNALGDLITPSAVLIDGEDIVVGREAIKGAAMAPDAFADCFKRDLGGYSYPRKLLGVDVPPEVLSALVLERLKADSEARLGPWQRAVITVPAFFDETRRKATEDAGRLAGIDVLDIINEPTAAALAFGYHQGFFDSSAPEGDRPMRLLVYDLGGGTFDVTILEIRGRRFETLATDGDVLLGGRDFDERLVHHLAEGFLEAHGVDPRAEPEDAQQLWRDAQELKHTLSERSKATLVCFHAGIRHRAEVTRSQFEELTCDLIERTETTTSLVIRQAGLTWEQIDRVLLVGGSSRMPQVRQMLQRVTGKAPDCSESADEAVAHGAALYAAMLAGSGQPDRPGAQLINVNSHSLGVAAMHPQTGELTNAILIPKNTRLPCRAVRRFKTFRNDQRSVKVSVVEGESPRPEACIQLGQCVVRDLPPGLPQGATIEVEYSYAANGRLCVSARIPSIRLSTHVRIERHHDRNLEDLRTWRARLTGAIGGNGEPMLSLAGPSNDPNDRGGQLQLDRLYTKIGAAAAITAVPAEIAHSHAAASAARAEYARATTALEQAKRERETAKTHAEVLRLDAFLARAKGDLMQAQGAAEFAYLVLGRECVALGFNPAGCEKEAQQCQALRGQLGA